jgi:hypothetical protein
VQVTRLTATIGQFTNATSLPEAEPTIQLRLFAVRTEALLSFAPFRSPRQLALMLLHALVLARKAGFFPQWKSLNRKHLIVVPDLQSVSSSLGLLVSKLDSFYTLDY